MRLRSVSSALRWLCVSLSAVWGGTAAQAGPDEAMLEKLFAGGVVESDFAPAFLQAVPFDQVHSLLQSEAARIGALRQITRKGEAYFLETDTHRIEVQLSLNASGQIAGLFLKPAELLHVDAATAEALLLALGDQVSWLATVEGDVVSAHRPEAALAVGSAFKLGVLQVLRDDIAQGLRRWSDVVTLEAHHKSLPSGDMRLLPEGSPLTLHTAAALMIAESDNTATDLLIDVLGRDRVARALDLPDVLTTREFFGLKASAMLRLAWIAAPDADKPGIAAQAAQSLPAISQIGPHDRGVEWYVPAQKLCAVITDMADDPILQINPGVLSGDWDALGYKGGSEEGVLNFTSVASRDGRTTCLVLTVNSDKPIDLGAASAAYSALSRVALDAD